MNQSHSEMLFLASVDEMGQGYVYEQETEEYVCLLCGQGFEKGVVYQEGDALYEAQRYVRVHIEQEHGSVFEHLLGLGKKVTGLSEVQSTMLELFYQGLSDKEIVEHSDVGSPSTVRNHRFTLREKAKQAKVFLVLMSLLEQQEKKRERKEEEKWMRRAELIREYKATPKRMGVFQLRNKHNGKVYVYTNANLDKIYTRLAFEMRMGTHLNRELVADWKEYGEENFAFEILEEIPLDDKRRENPKEALKELEEKWMEKLQPYGDRGYHKPRRPRK
ncbi:MAG TPA: hypothetical protein VFV52_12085 [Bacilli bacterium]|nr:hypothetical protein [Bacilli bacterium]